MGRKHKIKDILENSTVLIDWISSIYGILWGVFLSFFLQNVWNNLSDPQKLPEFLPINWLPLLIPGSVVVFGLFTFQYVKWLWMMRFVNSSSYSRRYVSFSRFPILFFIFILIEIVTTGKYFGISDLQIGLFLYASFVWPITVIFMMNTDWRGWSKNG